MSSYTIGETAERSGFSASALRYYEGIGLIEPTMRTDAGYRLYDDAALARLAFIGRAKQLGCNLDEITDLVTMWDRERCRPVQRRFHELLTSKIADAQRQIDELTAFVGELRTTAARLDAPAGDGPCSAECACMAPIACTASSDELVARIAQLERMRTQLDRLERTDTGLLLHFPDQPDAVAEIRAFTVDEKTCCTFWTFDMVTERDQVDLRWDGPPEVSDLFDQLVVFFEGDEPLSLGPANLSI